MANELTETQFLEIRKFLLKYQSEESIRKICRVFLTTPEYSSILNEMIEVGKKQESIQMRNFFNKVPEDVSLLMNFHIQSSLDVLKGSMVIALCSFAALNIHCVEDLLTQEMVEEFSEILSH